MAEQHRYGLQATMYTYIHSYAIHTSLAESMYDWELIKCDKPAGVNAYETLYSLSWICR